MQEDIEKTLINGGIGVLATDTLYGLVGSALSEEAVERIYRVRKRNPLKPCIILIADLTDLEKFNIEISAKEKKFLEALWPRKVSVVLPSLSEKFGYLHRSTTTLSFRIPEKNDLREILYRVGPLIAPSANIEGEPPAGTISEAKNYFGEKIDFYEDEGVKVSPPSTLIEIRDGKIKLLREGEVMFEDIRRMFNSQ